MSQFKKYPHLERFGTTEVQNIELGNCFIFPKLDGTNASLWLSEGYHLSAGSRNRELTYEKDNAGFYTWAVLQMNIQDFFDNNPKLRLYGEWLVPHSLKTYRENAWRNFYVFDVYNDEQEKFLPYNEYAPILAEYNIKYIEPLAEVKNPDYDTLVKLCQKNTYLIEDGKGVGEGIVLKNYEFVNKYGRVTWAKIVTNEFKESNAKTFGHAEVKAKKLIEEEIAKKYVTTALCEKVYAKIENESGFTSKNIPQLLNIVYYDVVREECWNFVKEHKNPTINFKTLQHLIFAEVKNKMPNLF